MMLHREKKRGKLRAFFGDTDMVLWGLCFCASVFGCILVFSATVGAGGGKSGYLVQFIASAVGLCIAFFMSRVDYHDICKLWFVWLGLAVFLVLLTFTPLGLNVSGTDDTAWLGFPIRNPRITFQPSEFLKIAFILSFATHLDKVKETLNRPLTLLMLCLHGGFACGLIFLQGDDGTALVFAFIFAAMLFAAGLHLGYFVAAFGAIAVAVPILWSHMDEQKKARFLSLIQVEEYAKTEGWQQAHGLSAIGSGRLWGLGFLKGENVDLFARNNDFIFTVAGEEMGFIGGTVLLLLLFLIILRVLYAARTAEDYTGMLICSGMAALLAAQSLINLGMVLRVLPVVGITLPFFSAGGSSVATLYLGMGLVMSVYCQSRMRSGGLFSKKR